jgi:hypothetical protein
MKCKRSWNETVEYFEGFGKGRKDELDFKIESVKSVVKMFFLRWKRCKDKMFMFKFKSILYLQEKKYLSWKLEFFKEISQQFVIKKIIAYSLQMRTNVISFESFIFEVYCKM